ncbi:hypothetical protein AAF712_012027 [Marasmius tenuissimus]|uniref:Chromo domain-containing protein n=1 Tax=Marasmius tenuissimus TaxID=585030 RepID=A0ABR2ZHM8_9AGAR
MAEDELYEVETIEKAKWEQNEWLYYIKWYQYSKRHNTWEPGSSLANCAWILGKFWEDVGLKNLNASLKPEDGFELFSTDQFRALCRARICEEKQTNADGTTGNAEETMRDEAILDRIETIVLESGNTCRVPEPGALWIHPECLGLKNLNAHERYQIVLRSLQSEGIDASTSLYKRVRKDTKEDSAWLINWGNGCGVPSALTKKLIWVVYSLARAASKAIAFDVCERSQNCKKLPNTGVFHVRPLLAA